MTEALPDLYVSADIETDGPIPGEYSMLSFAFSLAGRFDGTTFEPYEPGWDTTFYVELKPISERFEQAALDVNGLDREELAVSGRERIHGREKGPGARLEEKAKNRGEIWQRGVEMVGDGASRSPRTGAMDRLKLAVR